MTAGKSGGDLTTDVSAWLDSARTIAADAGKILMNWYGGPCRTERKGVVDLVTEADRAAESHILGAIRERFPEHSVLAEESAGTEWRVLADEGIRAEAPLWLIDPLDGTTNFAHGFPWFCVSIGVAVKGEVLAGVVHDPLRGETFEAAKGIGARFNGARVSVSSVRSLDESLLVTGFAYDIRTNPETNLDTFARFALRCQGVRRTGSAALDLCAVAAGRADGFWELRLKPWDTAAGWLIVQEAGGRVTDGRGDSFHLTAPVIVASNGRIHGEMIETLRTVKG